MNTKVVIIRQFCELSSCLSHLLPFGKKSKFFLFVFIWRLVINIESTFHHAALYLHTESKWQKRWRVIYQSCELRAREHGKSMNVIPATDGLWLYVCLYVCAYILRQWGDICMCVFVSYIKKKYHIRRFLCKVKKISNNFSPLPRLPTIQKNNIAFYNHKKKKQVSSLYGWLFIDATPIVAPFNNFIKFL